MTTKPKVTTSSSASTSASTVDPKIAAAFANAVKQSMANGSGNAAKGVVYTKQEADSAVQSVFQQLLGRNGVGVDYDKAIKAYLNQSQDTGVYGRTQAVENFVMNTPEYQAREENKYLDAIYAAVQADVRKARQ